jgi:hypothetical protein
MALVIGQWILAFIVTLAQTRGFFVENERLPNQVEHDNKETSPPPL